MTMTDIMIYVHIPFCDSKCFYCNFSSFVCGEDIKRQYFEKLNQEIVKNTDKNLNVTSIYIGGGTPSCVDERYIAKIIDALKTNFSVSKDAEISIEANPCSLTNEKIKSYLKCGINRISIGVQSLDNKSLKTIGRKHSKNQAIHAIKLAKQIGFKNINADLLIGIPGQTYSKLKRSAKLLLRQNITHLSAYMLINEPNTLLTRLIEKGDIKTVSEDECVTNYNKLTNYLNKHGFVRYEISNFAKDNFECKHNLGYWQLKNYLGFGVATHSFFDGFRYENPSRIDDYLKSNFEYTKNKLSEVEKIEEYLMLGLRTIYGVDITNLKMLGYDILKQKDKEINFLLKSGFLQLNNNHISVNNEHFGVLNQILLKLLP